MKIAELIKKIPEIRVIKGDAFSDVNYIWADSRKLGDKDIFVIPDDTETKQEEYLRMAVSKKVETILVSKKNLKLQGVHEFPNILESENALEDSYGKIASILCGYPSKKLKIIGVTGTNGKHLSVLFFSILQDIAEKKQASLGQFKFKLGIVS